MNQRVPMSVFVPLRVKAIALIAVVCLVLIGGVLGLLLGLHTLYQWLREVVRWDAFW